jgi:hypoxanthine phosphoribosyltransferase
MDIIYSAGEIANRIAQLGREITEFYRGEELTVVALMNGALPFAADLIRAIGLDCYVDTVSVASYRNCRSTGEPEFRSTLKIPPSGRHILLADEVLDSGVTLQCVAEYFRRRGAVSVRTVVMVEKELPRPNGLAHADWTGFTAPDRYLVGYGLDADEHYRNLPYIAALN